MESEKLTPPKRCSWRLNLPDEGLWVSIALRTCHETLGQLSAGAYVVISCAASDGGQPSWSLGYPMCRVCAQPEWTVDGLVQTHLDGLGDNLEMH